MNSTKPILLHIDKNDLQKIDEAAKIMLTSRSNFIREALKRNLAFFERHERPLYHQIKLEAYK